MLKKGEVKMIHKMLKDGLSKSAIARKLGIIEILLPSMRRCLKDMCLSLNEKL